jgi:transcriptional regulator with XRE-family HTH domain
MPHESPIVERIRMAVRHLMHTHGISQTAIAQRLGIAPSSVHGFVNGKQSLELRHLDALAERLGVTAAELVAHREGLKLFELTDGEARLLTTVRGLPKEVRDELLSVVHYLSGLMPEDEQLQQVVNHWNRMDAGERRHFLHLAVYLRDTGLPPDVRAGLGLPAATPRIPPVGGRHGARTRTRTRDAT